MNTAIMQEFEDFIVASAPKVESFHPHYQKALWEMLLAGGKRFRPALCLCVVDSIAPQMLKNAFIPALALEALHTYSLIHDDLPCMDNSPLRRGYPTLHTTYDETLALLVGDALNTYAFELLSTAKLDPQSKIALIYELSHNAGFSGMVLGQVLDCAFENTTISLEQLKMIHQNKTLKLIATSLRFGAIIGNASDEIRQCLDRFGEVLGLFFQVRDDLLDVLGDT
ncbi:MAG: polyprenyl synthetase family protein, partial [Helicobacter sp.]|nr:polyprenyl synthetase family protein [Helicobacter sp.]